MDTPTWASGKAKSASSAATRMSHIERELEAETEAVALHGGDDRLGQVMEDAEALVHPADALVVVAHLLGRRASGDPVLGHAEVDTGAESPALGLDQEDADAVIEAGAIGQDAELARGLPGPHVQLLGVVERQGADARAVLGCLEAQLPVLFGEHRFGADGHCWLSSPSGFELDGPVASDWTDMASPEAGSAGPAAEK